MGKSGRQKYPVYSARSQVDPCADGEEWAATRKVPENTPTHISIIPGSTWKQVYEFRLKNAPVNASLYLISHENENMAIE